MIKMSRIDDLLEGRVEPQDDNEELLLVAYTYGVSGALLANCLIDLQTEYTDLDELAKDYITLGYAIGQKNMQVIEEEMEELDKKGKTFH